MSRGSRCSIFTSMRFGTEPRRMLLSKFISHTPVKSGRDFAGITMSRFRVSTRRSSQIDSLPWPEGCCNRDPGMVSCSSWHRPFYDKPTSSSKINGFLYRPTKPRKSPFSVSFRGVSQARGDEESRPNQIRVFRARFLSRDCGIGMTRTTKFFASPAAASRLSFGRDVKQR
jgi:hypothetical protein